MWQFTSEQKINKLKILQKRCIRTLMFASHLEHSDPLFKSLKLLKISDLFNRITLIYFYKLSLGNLPTILNHFFDYFSSTHDHITRSENILRIPLVTTTRYGSNSLRVSGALLWNNFYKSVSDKTKISSLSKLKNYHKQSCLENYI